MSERTPEPARSASGHPAPADLASTDPTPAGPPLHVWVDGLLVPAATPILTATDRGFQVGDGVFETIRVCEGRILELSLHAARLAASASALEIPLEGDVEATIRVAIAELLAADDLVAPGLEVSVRVTVSRGGVEGRNLLPPARVRPTMVVQAWRVAPPATELLERGLHLAISGVRRDARSPLATVKTTSRAEFVYARLEARRAGADDALFLTTDGHLAEATSASLFLVRSVPTAARPGLRAGSREGVVRAPAVGSAGPLVDGPLADESLLDGPLVGTIVERPPVGTIVELATPSLECGILAGTTREWLLAWGLEVGLVPVQALLWPDDLFAADEAFLASSVAGVLPVTVVDGRPIGDGRPGPWTRRAREAREAFACR